MITFSFAVAFGTIAWLYTWWSRRYRTVVVAREVATLRAQLGGPVTFRAPGPDEAAAVAQVEARIAAALARLDLDGFTLLGDVIVEPLRQAPLALTRVWIDRAQTTVVLVGARLGDATPAVPAVSSITEQLEISTSIGPHVPMLAAPPFARRQNVPADLPFAEVVARHREFAGDDLVRITSFDVFVTELARFHAKHVAWRDTQAPIALLVADLRGLLGPAFERYGKDVLKRMLPRLPTATVRRRA